MSLYKQPGSDIWHADISVPHQERVRRSTGETDRRKAQQVHDEIKAQLWKLPRLSGNTWGKAVTAWVEKSPRSQSELLSLAKFARYFADRPLETITPEMIHTSLSFCKTAGTYTRYRNMIGAILRNAGLKITLISRSDKKRKARTWLTPEQWSRLYSELPPHLKPMAKFSVETGLRQSNVLGLTWGRVDLKRRLVWVEAEDAKGGEAISVPLSDDALETLHGQQGQHDEFVFTYKGRPIGTVQTAFQAACVRAGLGAYDLATAVGRYRGNYSGFVWHGLRHTWATWHAQADTPLAVLQQLGAWKDYRMVLNYAHHSPGHLASHANNIKKGTT